ncbi:MAG: lipopolysaccharide heptosyltransferase II [Phycisphaerae bacterium]
MKPTHLDRGCEPETILIVLPTWVGDFVMATPMLRAVRRRYAAARITFLADANLCELIRGGDWMDEVMTWPARSQRGLLRRPYRALVRACRARRFDLAITLANSFRSALIMRLAGARRRIGYDRDGRGMLLTDRVPVRNRMHGGFIPMPLVAYYADLAEAAGCDRPDDRLELFTTADADAVVAARLASNGVVPGVGSCGDPSRGPLVVISPGAKYGAAKCWPPERFAGVADRMIARHSATVVVTCGPGEEAIARAIAAAMEQRALVCDDPPLSLGELKSLIRGSDLLICNDAGPRHIAKAFGVAVVTVFGPTHPEWTATSYAAERIVRIDVDCGPCQQRTCPLGHVKCMTGVTVDAVYDAACTLMTGVGRRVAL